MWLKETTPSCSSFLTPLSLLFQNFTSQGEKKEEKTQFLILEMFFLLGEINI